MDSALKVFENEVFGQVRVVERDSDPWFVAKDVCDCLEIRTDTIRVILEEDEIATMNPNSIGVASGGREMLIISEPGLYSLVLRSRKQEAKAFKRWITREVIPTIRKHGAYLTPDTIERALSDPDTIIKLATSLKEERIRRTTLEMQTERDRPKVVFTESIEVAKTSILVGEMEKLITQSTGHTIGQNRMFEWLKDRGYLHRNGSQKNMPTQRAVESGWFEIKEGTRIGSSGECHITKTSKVTGKGQIYFVNLFKKMSEAQAI